MYTLIINPESGQGAALANLPAIQAVLDERHLEYQVLKAASPEMASEYARCACTENAEGVIAIGGDGTLFQIVNGMISDTVPMIFIPCGTGNDFIKSLNLPANPVEALKVQLDAPITHIDIGRMNDIRFLNVSGTGFDVDVLRFAEKYKRKYKGLKAYLFALYDALKTYRPMTAMVSIDGSPEERMSFAILSIGNGRFIGGGMKAVPLADVSDGLFDVVIVKPVRKFMILPLIALYIAGKHIAIKLAVLKRCKRLTIRCDGMTVNLDGELRDVDCACFELLQNALAVRVPLKTKKET